MVVPSGGVLIDTPGLRSLGLASGEALRQVFPDIEELASECRFSDCRHNVEPGCAIAAAITSGELDSGRVASFRKLQREVSAEARRTDPLLRKAEVSVWKARTKQSRARAKHRPRG
jgi:ribosome biogenesis GTPase